MKILVAEDEPIMLKTIELRLKKDGHTVITADNGRDAMSHLNDHDLDMVITDIMMPFASGLEIVGKLRTEGKKTPVIVLSTMGQENIVLEAFTLGANDYITKPFSPNELSMRVKRFMLMS